MNARINAFLEQKLPGLDDHVNSHLAKCAEALRLEVDTQLSEQFLRQTSGRKVFGGRANHLRWQNARHQALQQSLDRNMKIWMLEAIQGWEPQGASEEASDEAPPQQPAEPLPEAKETDRIYALLTKRAAQFDNLRLPSEIPRVKTIRPSYSLPSMWRDKYPN